MPVSCQLVQATYRVSGVGENSLTKNLFQEYVSIWRIFFLIHWSPNPDHNARWNLCQWTKLLNQRSATCKKNLKLSSMLTNDRNESFNENHCRCWTCHCRLFGIPFDEVFCPDVGFVLNTFLNFFDFDFDIINQAPEWGRHVVELLRYGIMELWNWKRKKFHNAEFHSPKIPQLQNSIALTLWNFNHNWGSTWLIQHTVVDQ